MKRVACDLVGAGLQQRMKSTISLIARPIRTSAKRIHLIERLRLE
ncbi:MAG: hypothetical protein ACLGJB_26110 [Blastocatellia bacterium]